MYESLYLGNGTSDHQIERFQKTDPLKVTPKTWENSPQKPLLATRKWFSAIAAYKTGIFSLSPQWNILKMQWNYPYIYEKKRSVPQRSGWIWFRSSVYKASICCSANRRHGQTTCGLKLLLFSSLGIYFWTQRGWTIIKQVLDFWRFKFRWLSQKSK